MSKNTVNMSGLTFDRKLIQLQVGNLLKRTP